MFNKNYLSKFGKVSLILISTALISCSDNGPSDKIVVEQVNNIWFNYFKNNYSNFKEYYNTNTIETTFHGGYPINKDLNISDVIIIDRGELDIAEKNQRIKVMIKGSTRFEEFVNNPWQTDKNITKYDRKDKGIHNFEVKNIYLFEKDDFGKWTCEIVENIK